MMYDEAVTTSIEICQCPLRVKLALATGDLRTCIATHMICIFSQYINPASTHNLAPFYLSDHVTTSLFTHITTHDPFWPATFTQISSNPISQQNNQHSRVQHDQDVFFRNTLERSPEE